MATHRVKVREDLLQKLITLSDETGKPISDLTMRQTQAPAGQPAEAA